MGEQIEMDEAKDYKYPCTARIYWILNDLDGDKEPYVGHTTLTLKERMDNHRRKFTIQNREGRPFAHPLLYGHMKRNGFDKFYIELLWEFEAGCYEEIRLAEQRAIDEYATLNSRRAYRTEEEHRQQHNEACKRRNATAEGKAYTKEHANKWNNDPDRGGSMIKCPCYPKPFKKTSERRHNRSQKHKTWAAKQEN